MLGTVVEKLQSLLPKQFFLASLAPVLLLLLANGTLLFLTNAEFRDFATLYFLKPNETESLTTNMTILVLVIVLLAFFYSMVNTRLRELLEGQYWPNCLRKAFIRHQRGILNNLENQYDQMDRDLKYIQNKKSSWLELLQNSRKQEPPKPICNYSKNSEAAKEIQKLRQLRDEGADIPVETLERAVNLLSDALKESKIDPIPENYKIQCQLINGDQEVISQLISYATVRLRDRVIELFNKRQFNFPHENIAPTAMGNIEGSIGSYTWSRYGFNIDMLWIRLQKVMQGDTFYGTVQNAKTQLDFLVSTLWLVVLSLIFWLIYLTLFGYSVMFFLLVAGLGPLLAAILYFLCVQNYRAFADLLRSSVDLYRMRLLKELNLPLPEFTGSEKQMWLAINQQLRYGEDINIPFKHNNNIEDL